MSFRVTFDGSLTGRTDVPQMTATSNLTTQTTLTPNRWESPTNIDPFGQFALKGPADIVDNTYDTIYYAGLLSVSNFGDRVEVGNAWWGAHTPALPVGTYNWEMRICSSTAATQDLNVYRSNNTGSRQLSSGRDTLLYTVTMPTSGSSNVTIGNYAIYSGSISITNSNQWILFEFGDVVITPFEATFVDYIRITTTTAASISVTTTTNGVAPTGGTPTTATPSTVVDGAAGTAGPAKAFGAVVEHDGSDIMSAKYYPPADNAQNAKMSLKKKEIITATNTSISVRGEGLDATDTLQAADTSIIVKEYTDATEN